MQAARHAKRVEGVADLDAEFACGQVQAEDALLVFLCGQGLRKRQWLCERTTRTRTRTHKKVHS